MRHLTSRKSQRGITLFVGMIMLVLITVMVTSAFMLSNSNLKAVGNMQAKEEAVAAANQAIERVLSSKFTDDPVAEEINIDINSDGTNDFVVNVAEPECVRASIDTPQYLNSDDTPLPGDPTWNTVWNIEATVDNLSTGARTTVASGARVLLTNDQKLDVCN